MAIEQLNIGAKTANQGINAAGKLSAVEFNSLIDKVNEMITELGKRVFISQDAYDALVANDALEADVEYNVYEE